MNVTLARVWKFADVAGDLRTALEVVEQLEPPEDLRVAVFNMAAQLVTQRIQVQADARAIVPKMAVSLPSKRH